MKDKAKRIVVPALFGVLVGVVNGMFGAGGGMIAVPVLKKLGFDQKSAHANAVAVILPIAAVSTVAYLIGGNVRLADAWPYIPTGVLGAAAATLLMKKISPVFLRLCFGGFMVWAGIRLWLK